VRLEMYVLEARIVKSTIRLVSIFKNINQRHEIDMYALINQPNERQSLILQGLPNLLAGQEISIN